MLSIIIYVVELFIIIHHRKSIVIFIGLMVTRKISTF